MKKVLVTARSFGKIAETPFQVLRDGGLEVVMHPRRGPLEKHEMIPLIGTWKGSLWARTSSMMRYCPMPPAQSSIKARCRCG